MKRAYALLTALLFPLTAFSIHTGHISPDIRTLEPGKPIERELSGGQAHEYNLALAAGTYLYVIVDQRGIDVVVRLAGPDGRLLMEVDSPNGINGPEPLQFIAQQSGSYRLTVASLENKAAPGRYEARIEELRPAQEKDRKRMAGVSALAEAEKLAAAEAAESKKAALEKAKAASALFHEIDEQGGEARSLFLTGELYSALGEKKKAIETYEQVKPLARAIGDKDLEAKSFTSTGTIYWTIFERQKALECNLQALPLLRAAGDRLGEGTTLYLLGRIYSALGNPQKAVESFQQALPLIKPLKQPRIEALALLASGTASLQLAEI